jgi:Lon protease-like protein
LPNVVLFPGVFLPLHIFEPRYRAMTRDALAGDRIIGISLLRPGFEADYDGRPDVYPVGCAGLIAHSERLPDGRFNLVLNGLEKYRILGELEGGEYRRAQVETLDEPVTDADRAILEQRRPRLEAALVDALRAGDVQIPDALSGVDLVHALCQYLQFSPAERQALLECGSPVARGAALIDLLEMQAMMAKHPGRGSSEVH